MGSVGDDETNTRKGANSNSIIDTGSAAETETIDRNSREFQNSMSFNDTIPIENETQELEDSDCDENVRTQLLLDECETKVSSDNDDEGTDRTEVLSDTEEISDDDSESAGVGDDPVTLEKRQSSPCEHGVKDFVADSDERHNSGSEHHVSTASLLDQGAVNPNTGPVRRSIMSVRIASLRASGLAAACKMTSMGTDSDRSSILSNGQSDEEHVNKNNWMGIKDPALIGTKVREVDQAHDARNCNGNMKGFRDETKCRGGKSAVRKLFTKDLPAGNNGSMMDNGNIIGGRDFPELLACDQEFVGLSYVESQEPGELSQANALGVVDRFLSVNNVELSQEVDPGKTVKGKSPPVSSAKGPQSLAQRASFRIPVGEVGTFDWVDSREDEGGGDFFSKRKEAFFGSNGRGRRSLTQPQKPRHLNFRKGRCIVEKLEEKEEGSNLRQKIMGLSHSDSRLMFYDSKGNETQISEMKTKKNLFKELDEQLNPECSAKQLEATGISKDSPDTHDIGIDTQMAAEAMEALICGGPASHDTEDVFQVTQNVTEVSLRDVTKNKVNSTHVDLLSDSGGILRRSKRTKILDTKLSREAPISSQEHTKNPRVDDLGPDSAVTTKGRKGKLKAEQNLNAKTATNGNVSSGKRSSKFVEQRKRVVKVDRAHIKEVDGCHSPTTSNVNLSSGKGQLQEDYRTFTPIARRTRQSVAVMPLKRTENSSRGSVEGTNDLMEVSILREKRGGSGLSVDALEAWTVKGKSSKFGSNPIGEVGKNKPSWQEPPALGGPCQEIATANSLKRDALSYPRRITRRNTTGCLNKSGNLGSPPTLADGEDANGQSIRKSKRSKVDVRSTCVNLDMKRKTQSSAYPHPSSSSSEKNSEGSLIRRNVVDPGPDNAGVSCSLAVMNEKMVPEDQVGGAKASVHSGKKGDVDHLSSAEAEGNARLEVSPRVKIKSSGSACVTPMNCTTPINAASPVCIGDDYHKQSFLKGLSRSSLMRELIRLDATEAVTTPASKDLRRRRDMANVRVLFSHHLDEDIIKQQKKILARLGVSIASSSSDATHFVTDKFVRTRNMLEAMALGKPVVTHLWLESCGKASCFIDEKNYILRDLKKEKQIGFSMPVSLACACKRSLLQGKRVFITPNIKPGKELIASLVKAVHGQAVERIGRSVMKDDKVQDDLLVLSCEEDYAICVPLLEKGAAVYSSELLLNGIVIQKLEHERHRIFTDHVKRTRSTIWLRKDGDQFLPVTKRK